MKKNKQGKTTKKSVKRFILLALVLVIILAALWLLKEKMSSSQESSPKEETAGDENCNSIGTNNCYCIKNDLVYFKFPTYISTLEADPKTFEELGSCYGKDKDNFYYRYKKIQGVDLATMKYHETRNNENDSKNGRRKTEGFFTDKNGLYAISRSYDLDFIKDADPETFENHIFEIDGSSGPFVSRDKNNLYYNNKYKIEGIIDIKSFGTHKDYLKDKYHVYWLDYKLSKNDSGETVQRVKILDLNPNTLRSVGWAFVKDENNVYHYDKKLPLADAKTFEAVPSQSNEAKYTNYTKDKNHVYYYDQIVGGADPATFEGESPDYSKDKNGKYIGTIKLEDEVRKIGGYETDGKNVWYSYGSPKAPIEGADAKTFEPLGDKYHAKDKNQVYFGPEPTEHADPATFELLNDKYSKDKNYVYRSISMAERHNSTKFKPLKNDPYSKDRESFYEYDEVLAEADPATFELIKDEYTKDKNHVYYCSDIIEGADPATFEVLEDPYSKDKDRVYTYDEVVEGADPKSFEVIEEPYSKDKNHIYYSEKIIGEADMESFEILEEGYSKDKNHIYSGEKIYSTKDEE